MQFTQSVRSTPQETGEIDYSEIREAAKRFTENPSKENREQFLQKFLQKLKELNKKS